MTSLLRFALPLALACSTTPPVAEQPVVGQAHGLSPVQIETGLLAGAAAGDGEDGAVAVFRGIPFAAPPVGDRRWRPPEPAAPWSGVRRADRFSPSCQQEARRSLLPWTEEYMSQNEVSEDCLALNVWTGARSNSERRPVLVYIHGGAYTSGSGGVLIYDGEALARRGVIVVTINYRLGVFGFFAHPELTRESPHAASGNYGLQDQIAALGWVQRNIAAFGGDPGRVTVAGQSAGAGSVHLLTTSPLARGLFQRAIAQSGAWDPRQSLPGLRESEARGAELAEALGLSRLAQLRALPAAALHDASAKAKLPLRPIVDGWVVPDQVPSVYARGEQLDVPLLTGLTADEGSFREEYGALGVRELEALVHERFPGQEKELLALYGATSDADAHERQKQLARAEGLAQLRAFRATRAQRGSAPDFAYFFERAIPWPEQPRYQAFHSGELPYMFDNLSKLDRPWEDVDRQLAEQMASYWVNFISSGDPNGPGLPRWPSDRQQVMRLGARSRAEALPSEAEARALAGAFAPR